MVLIDVFSRRDLSGRAKAAWSRALDARSFQRSLARWPRSGFVVTVTVLVVQMVTGTFSARCIRPWYRDRVLKAGLALLIATLAFSFSLLRRIETNFVPDIGVTVAGSSLP